MNAFVFFPLFLLISGAKLPRNFQKCNRKEPDLKECIFNAAQDGINQLTKAYPEINIPNVNPFKVPLLVVGASKGMVAVEQKFKDCEFSGFHMMNLNTFGFDFQRKTLNVVGTFPEIKKQCHYEMDGKVLLLPIKGQGPSTVTLKNLYVKSLFTFEEEKKKGKTYIKFLSSEITLDPELVTFNFENLFNGDKRLSDNINQVLNDNWKEVFDEVKGDYVQIIDKIILSLLTNFFAKASLEEILD